ncbi:erythromycin esterase-like protein [Cytobacillus firmus]|uniref:Erythromycin esterase-like protein n=2 Tax=Cytobacillus TaxID=2675230 RepID=A0A366JR12_CYTFI|nr:MULTISPECIES: erythromycin esterase family protein [Cytobacillus]RBP90037.1 erythromycin esterase-like protein [Cytobacillus firmus]TDX40485.1 erythromycin esterase-like protein [Cytobacillus oceanisediminis]
MNFITRKTKSLWIDQIASKSSEITDPSDFTCMDPYVEGKRIVLLGESSHGVGDFYTSKINMIKYLHKAHGYNVIVVESGLLEAVFCRKLLKDLPAREQIQHGLLDIYHNEEMLPLFLESWAKGLHLAGMDIQPAYQLISQNMLEWLKIHTDAELYASIHQAETVFFNIDEEIRGRTKIRKQIREQIEVCMNLYQSSLELFESRWKEDNPEKEKIFHIIGKGLENRLKWLEINTKSWIASGVTRGRHMSGNLQWLMEECYKGEKVIVWAHNFHIRKSKTVTSKLFGITNVGQQLSKCYGDQVYSIGFYAGEGELASLLRVNFPINVSNKQLESLLMEACGHDSFIPLCEKGLPQRNWLNRRWQLLEAGMMGLLPISIHPQKHYDGIMFCRKVKPPIYFKRDQSNV